MVVALLLAVDETTEVDMVNMVDTVEEVEAVKAGEEAAAEVVEGMAEAEVVTPPINWNCSL